MHFNRNHHSLPLVNLPNVDDSYPPQRKSFLMLQFMIDHVLDRLDHIQWFLRADDDVYIHLPRLERFLNGLNSSQSHFIGQAGLGRGPEFQRLRFNRNENFCMGGPGVLISRTTLVRLKGQLADCVQSFASTHEDVEVSRCVRSHAQLNCSWSFEMQKLFFHNYSGPISLFDQESDWQANIRPDKTDLNHVHEPIRILNEAITLHPIKEPRKMLRAHEYFLRQEIKETRARLGQVEQLWNFAQEKVKPKQVDASMWASFWNFSEFRMEDFPNFLSLPSSFENNSRRPDEMINYEFIQLSAFNEFKDNPQRRIESHTRILLQHSITRVLNILNGRARPQRLQIDFNAFDYALVRTHSEHGIDFLVRVKLHFKQFGAQASHRQEWRLLRYRLPFESAQDSFDYRPKTSAVESSRRFPGSNGDSIDRTRLAEPSHFTLGRPPLSPFNSNLERKSRLQTIDSFTLPPLTTSSPSLERLPTTPVHIIVPLSGRFDIFERFLGRLARLASLDPLLYCVVVLFPDETEDNPALQSDYRRSKLLLKQQQQHFPDRLGWIDQRGPFSRANALQTAVRQLSSDSLLFFVDVDMVLLSPRVVDRVRLNTRQNSTAYFPIVFSEYSPEFTDAQTGHVFHSKKIKGQTFAQADLRPHIGYWRQHGFGIASIFRSDLDLVGGLNLTIQGWGKEDVDLYAACVRRTRFEVIRAPDPDLLHVHHDIHCKHNLEMSQFEMCLGSKFSSLGELYRLAGRILEHNLLT